MTQFRIDEIETNFSKIVKMLEDEIEDKVIITRNEKPILEIKLYEENNRKKMFGSGIGTFKIPKNFDDIDIANDFEGNI